MKERTKYILGIFFVSLGIAVVCINAFKREMSFFLTPSHLVYPELSSSNYDNKIIRVGGYVEKGSYTLDNDCHYFLISDPKASFGVFYKGVLPPLFKEGQGIVVEGTYKDHAFYATKIFAKHDEKYAPQNYS